jgi:hypothetical protein
MKKMNAYRLASKHQKLIRLSSLTGPNWLVRFSFYSWTKKKKKNRIEQSRIWNK